MKKHKNRKARLDADGTAKPLTQIKAIVKSGKLNMGNNILGYEVSSQDPHDKE